MREWRYTQQNTATRIKVRAHARGRLQARAYQLPTYAVPPNLTDTSFDTPGSCIVTPYNTGAMLIVFLLWVMSTNCVCTLISFTSSVNRPIFASSKGASTSSRMQNGLGAYWNIPTSKD